MVVRNRTRNPGLKFLSGCAALYYQGPIRVGVNGNALEFFQGFPVCATQADIAPDWRALSLLPYWNLCDSDPLNSPRRHVRETPSGSRSLSVPFKLLVALISLCYISHFVFSKTGMLSFAWTITHASQPSSKSALSPMKKRKSAPRGLWESESSRFITLQRFMWSSSD